MSYQRSPVPGWGPQPPAPGWRDFRGLAFAAVFFFVVISTPTISTLTLLVAIAVGLVRVYRRRGHLVRHRRPAFGADPLSEVLAQSADLGGGVYLGLSVDRRWRLSRPERAVLLLGPPRSGKTSAVIIPSVLAHGGPAVSTSTKPDVLAATAAPRSRLGGVWAFDPTGTSAGLAGVEQLRWSPVTSSASWDGALLMARAMVTGAGVGAGTTDRSHWARRAQALLAPLLHAAALGGRGIDGVVEWVLAHELDEPGKLLIAGGAELAGGVLLGVAGTEARERSSIFSSAADAIDAYTASGALAAARDPNFDVDRFIASCDTIYIDAPADRQHLAAPLVCGLLSEIREATYRAHRHGTLTRRVLFALDEVANIAPLDELPAIASEGGGQGLHLIAALQDLSQARARWGAQADGFLTLFGTKLILPGVADHQTLESISVALGEYDRQVVSRSRSHGGHGSWQNGQTLSIQRQRVLSPGEVAGIPAGHGLHLDGIAWELVRLTPAHRTQPWAALCQTGPVA